VYAPAVTPVDDNVVTKELYPAPVTAPVKVIS
jgi:hypothetical protein